MLFGIEEALSLGSQTEYIVEVLADGKRWVNLGQYKTPEDAEDAEALTDERTRITKVVITASEV